MWRLLGLISVGVVLCGQVREEQKVLVDGVVETWQLRWKSPPKPVCEANDISLTCPCTGFAFGEGGDLELVRIREGAVIDRLHLTPFFDEILADTGRVAIVKRWEPDYGKDHSIGGDEGFAELVAKRPVARVMDFADYDHDGVKSEFFLQTSTRPCGKRYGIVVGVSKSKDKLHAFRGARDALVLRQESWDALRQATGPVRVVQWTCNDHGADQETEVELSWTKLGIEGITRQFSCGSGPRVVVSEEPL